MRGDHEHNGAKKSITIPSDIKEALTVINTGKTKSRTVAEIQEAIREKVETGFVVLQWISSKDNPADRILKNLETPAADETTMTATATSEKIRWRNWDLTKWKKEWDSVEKGRELYSRCKEVGLDSLPLTFKGVQLST